MSSRPFAALLPFSFLNRQNIRLVYRVFATLYFIFLVDQAENELAVLDLIQCESAAGGNAFS